jgi:hypothetical protein
MTLQWGRWELVEGDGGGEEVCGGGLVLEGGGELVEGVIVVEAGGQLRRG